MFGWKLTRNRPATPSSQKQAYGSCVIEALEERRMLSASAVHHAVKHALHHATAKHASLKHANKETKSSTTSSTTTTSSGTSAGTSNVIADPGQIVDTIEFSQAPAAVQTGLSALASKDGLIAPTSTQIVYLGNSNGVESYTLNYTTSGTTTSITVDPGGDAITASTQSTTTWATLDGTGTGGNAAAAAEIAEIATALGLAAPTSTTTVNVSSRSDGTSIYTVHLSSASSSTLTGYANGQGTISVDSTGDPVGNQNLPFSVIPPAIQDGFNNNLPTGVTALASTSTQIVKVETVDGVNLYSTTFTAAGTSTTITVNSLGALASLPTETTADFSDIPAAAQSELQTLATADGATGAISSGQTVQVYTEANGTVIYSVTLSATNSDSQAVTLTISVDQSGNPTVPPQGSGGCNGGDMNGFNGDGPSGHDFGAVDFGLSSFGGGHF